MTLRIKKKRKEKIKTKEKTLNCEKKPSRLEKHMLAKHKKKTLNCDKCNNKCKKPSSLEKHMLAKHKDHVCKECHEKITSFMESIKHHHKDEEEDYVRHTKRRYTYY